MGFGIYPKIFFFPPKGQESGRDFRKAGDFVKVLSVRAGLLARPGVFRYPYLMEPGISIITLGVFDLNRSITFYRESLGLPNTYMEGQGITFFQLKATWLALYPSDALAPGARLLKPAADTFWCGYSGYFSDPDDHPWEVAWNPFFPLE
jgi:uncharacterized protein